MLHSSNPIPPKIREVEQEIDNLYKTNPLVNLPFAEAAWHLLSYVEGQSVAKFQKGSPQNRYGVSIYVENIIDEILYPIYWLWTSCSKGGSVPKQFRESLIPATHDLARLGIEYIPFVMAFTYASRGVIDLALDGPILKPIKETLFDPRSEAYGHLLEENSLPRDRSGEDFFNQIDHALVISGDKFKYQLGRRLIDASVRSLNPVFDDIYRLPGKWQFSNFSADEFRRMASYLMGHAFIHFMANQIAAMKLKDKIFIDCGVIVLSQDELVWNLIRYANVNNDKAKAFISQLTYGNAGIRSPSITLQPLLKINEHDYLISPSLLISNSLERNYTVLINRIPSERVIYSKLVQKKEELLRKQVEFGVTIPHLRFLHAKLPLSKQLPDIDLAIVSDIEKSVIVSELKWFISPSEPQEVISKNDEIEKGISQVSVLNQTFLESPEIFYGLLGVDETYKFTFVVMSENFIGLNNNDAQTIPVVNVHHFIKKLNQIGSLAKISSWLVEKDYLPVEGEHFVTTELNSNMGKWSLIWQGIKPLITDEYL